MIINQDFRQRIKVMCLFSKNGKTLASKGFDEVKNETFYRVLGGGVEFQEKSEDAIRREIQEELKCEVENLELVTVVDSIFTYLDKRYHDVVFLYRGDLSNKDLYAQEKISIIEPYAIYEAEWIPIEDIVSGKKILYPSGVDFKKVFSQ